MERLLKKDLKFKKALTVTRIIYILTAIAVVIMGIVRKSTYEILIALSTLLAIPALYLLRRLFHLKGGYQLETYIYLFFLLSWSLGGAAEFYALIPHFDKAVHFLSGVFVAMVALALYRMLERSHSREGENPATGCIFVFSVSMAVAGLFELTEFSLAPLIGRDLQHVMETGTGDTMGDMFVCMLGTLIVVLLMTLRFRGKHDIFTDAAEAFALQNPPKSGQQPKQVQPAEDSVESSCSENPPVA